MTITVSSGVTSNFLTISSGDPLVVLSGGTVDYPTVNSGASATLSSGALGENLTVSSGGVLLGAGDLQGDSSVAGSLDGALTLENDGFLELISGGTASGLTITAPAASPYSYFQIDYGALASATVVTDAYIDDFGSASNTRIGSGGEEDIYEGGRATGDVVESGGRLFLSGGAEKGAVVESGGLLVLWDGEIELATVQSGGTLGIGPYLTSDFTAGPVASTTVISGVTVSSGGVLELYDAEVAEGATLSLAGTVANDLFVDPGGVVKGPGAVTGQSYVEGAISGASIGGQLELVSGGTAIAVTVAVDGSLQIDFGATDKGATALSGALINVLGSASGVLVGSKGEEYVNSGGVDAGATVEQGGEELVYSGAAAAGDTIQNGGLLILQGGTVTGETVQSGGTVDFQGLLTGNVTPGRATSTTVLDGVTIASGAVINVDSATVANGARVSVAVGTIVSDLNVDAGGAVVGPGALAGFDQVAGALSDVTIEGDVFLTAGAVATALTVASGGAVLGPGDLAGVNKIAGQVSGLTLAAGGALELLGGTASAMVLAGQANAVRTEFEIDSGGTASGTEVGSNTEDVIRSGGVASASTVLNGGLEYVLIGGMTTGTRVSAGGEAIVSSGGVARGLVLLAGGVLIDNGEVRIGGAGTLAGTLSGDGAVIETEPADLVLSGSAAAFTGKAVISRGTIELATSHALGGGYVQFVEPTTGSAVLRIDAADAPAAGGTFANRISDFSGAEEDIDLGSIAFAAGASATLTGSTLVLTDGGKTYAFDIAGSTAAGYSVTSDGHGGTLIDPKAALFTQTAAAFAPPDAAKIALVSSTSSGQTPFLHATASATAGHP